MEASRARVGLATVNHSPCHQDYVSQTQKGGSSSQPRTDPPRSPINAFPIEELYTPEFLESLQANTGYWQAPNTYEAAEEEVALAKGWLAISENSKDGNAKKKQGFWCEVLEYIESKTKQYGRRTDKARAAGRKNKGSKPAGSSTLNEDGMARLMVTEMTAQEKEERLAFLDIKRREAECRGRELEQQDMMFYLHPYDHLTGDQQNAMEEIRAKIKAKYNLQY
ncbi:hypothetical protein Tco_1345904 [Tanacetum coccineum]